MLVSSLSSDYKIYHVADTQKRHRQNLSISHCLARRRKLSRGATFLRCESLPKISKRTRITKVAKPRPAAEERCHCNLCSLVQSTPAPGLGSYQTREMLLDFVPKFKSVQPYFVGTQYAYLDMQGLKVTHMDKRGEGPISLLTKLCACEPNS